MRHFTSLLALLAAFLLSVAASSAADPWDSTYGSNSLSQRFSPYADGSSRPLNPGLNDRTPCPQPVTPTGSPSRDYNLFTPDGKMHLCTATKDAVYSR